MQACANPEMLAALLQRETECPITARYQHAQGRARTPRATSGDAIRSGSSRVENRSVATSGIWRSVIESSDSCPDLTRRIAKAGTEEPIEVGNIGKASLQCDVANTDIAFALCRKERERMFQP